MSDDPNGSGFGKPPRHSQFKPGQSGNPRGRPKGARGVKTDLAAELNATWTTSVNGQPIKGTKQRLMFRTLTARAATGDVKAAAVLLPLILTVLGVDDRGGEGRKLSSQDQALLDEILETVADQDSTDEAAAGDANSASPASEEPPEEDTTDG
ncbi:MAG: DUF5681 domain-containing protein [Novosphingobium sp.]